MEAEIKKFEANCSIAIQWDALEDILQPTNYINHWRISLWDKAFKPLFHAKANPKFTKGLKLKEFDGGLMATKQVAYQ